MPLPGLLAWALLSVAAPLGAGGAALSFRLRDQPVRQVSPAFLSLTLDANLATDPRYITFLRLFPGEKG
ncbi:UNVERIFIED_CONTAM: hypothetical protein K2H54_024390 [Gekko kuhli]